MKKDINFFAKTEFKNKETIFGIKTPDRRKHVYVIGKTGAGKSTLIANMAIDDIRKDRGIGIIDPHGRGQRRGRLALRPARLDR